MRIIELVREGRSPESLAREFEPSGRCIRNWVRQADRDAGRRQDGLTTDDRAELQRLRRENAALREEREILKKAAAGSLKGILEYTEEPLVSVDFNHNAASGTVDAPLTKVLDGTLVKVCAWYDNEWGFSNRMLDTTIAWSRAG